MLAGEAPVIQGFTALDLPSTAVRTAKTGLREALILGRHLRALRAEALIVDRPRDLRLGALASLAQPIAILNRYNLSRENPPPDLLSHLAYQRVRLTVFVSETSARRALDRARYLRRRPYRVIPGAVDTQQFYPDSDAAEDFRRSFGLEGRAFVIAVGSLTLDKRYDFLLEVMAHLRSPGTALVICGAGSLAEKLRTRARELSLDVRLLGQLGPDELRGGYNAAHCMLHGGAIETFGLSVLEAMACGRAVVAVHGGAVPEVIGDAGLLAPVDDSVACAGLVRRVLEDSSLRASLGAAARSRAIERFSLAEMRRQYVEAIESICL
jgi:glycosyltransferase involved in cell wall biosynthesis